MERGQNEKLGPYYTSLRDTNVGKKHMLQASVLLILSTQWQWHTSVPVSILWWPALAKPSLQKGGNIFRAFCWCCAITVKTKITRFSFHLCKAVKLCGLCRIKRLFFPKLHTFNLKVVNHLICVRVLCFFFSQDRQYVHISLCKKFKQVIHKGRICQVFRKVKAKLK